MKYLLRVIIVAMFFTGLIPTHSSNAENATKYITKKEFIKELVTELKLDLSTTFQEPYLLAVSEAGIMKSEDFNNNYEGYITRTDAAVLLNRADEYLHGDTVDADLLNCVLSNRISDIKKVSSEKREAVAKCVTKGIIKGFSNGYYIKSRSFRGNEYLTETTAKEYIKLVTNKEKRAILSPDGMLIRTTNLPKNASRYEYILECYPNVFYEKKFEFMITQDLKKANPDYYAYPVEMKKENFKNWYDEWPLVEEMDKYLYKWEAMAEKYLQYVFNVDYRTVDDKWIEGLASLYAKSNIDDVSHIKKYYIGKIKKNKVVIESSIIAVEPSTLYDDIGCCMRAYVRYRISAKNINVNQGDLLCVTYPALNGLKNGEWREGIFDVRFGTNNGSSGNGSDFTICKTTFYVDDFNVAE